MNRIRKNKDVYQVLITPDVKMYPDASLMLGNWSDENLRGYYVEQFESLNDAQYEAYKYPDLDWYKLVLNHQYIFTRLDRTIRSIINDNKFSAEIRSNLMDPDTLKNTMFDRVLAGERFNLKSNLNDIISFTIINPWSSTLKKITTILENYQYHLYRDDLRLKHKKVVDGKITILYGVTEFGTTYEIRLVPSLLQQWIDWHNKVGYKNPKHSDTVYNKMLNQQNKLDSNIVLN